MRLASVRAPALAALLLLVLALAVALAVRPPEANASTSCPAAFRVLHNDRVGALSLPAGSYRIRVQGLSCGRAANLFPVFLNDYDGRLPGGWTVGVRGSGRGVFRNGAASFSVTRRSSSGGGGGPVVNLTCAGTFTVPAPTQAGLLPLPAGGYRLTRLSTISPTCGQATQLLTGFVGQSTQLLPGGWVSLPDDGAFVNGSTTYGFRVDAVR
jgi:hypothetical protein